MKNWKNNRPDGWDVFQIREDNLDKCSCEESWIEAGADAMLEAMMKHRVKMPPDYTPILIVIPSEEAKK